MHRRLLIDSYWRPFLTQGLVSKETKNWLTYPASLTERLRQSFGEIEVVVLRDELGFPLADEYGYVNNPKQPCRVREVLLCHHGEALVFAHSIIPLTPQLSKHYALAKLGNQPLGHWLFQQPQISRQALFFKQLRAHHNLYRLIPTPQHPSYWARRSWFKLHNEGLLVTEVFLKRMPYFKA
ncbi:chorismate lyase [Ferrovum sp. PN-J185]|uniref:chorismate--pyruvate lyase family protein n=1 Tax=Ferrovum sp. PN-J185 TaxID=1356306 RepID=UPI000798C5C0|nr:chorismate lyase [Ferrovum sp. PN-J185]KXW56518.1 chorismate pyruvate-lyase [Ferrovum sp. PN-J185]MCC6068133.1 chorismate lyase [Ferrovum sp. PN-J185]MDE1891754.1 chorismate lyase [Betaproteobacteria bacterium]MDE2056404.1 chorismate lyase [Betaproteobacteria bacterium]